MIEHEYKGCQYSRACHHVLRELIDGAEICGKHEREHVKVPWWSAAAQVGALDSPTSGTGLSWPTLSRDDKERLLGLIGRLQ